MAKTVLFGRYRLDQRLGSGGSAQVWRAVDRKTGDVVAVKRLHPLVFADDAGRERLLREFRALRDLHEPHIVRVRDLELTDDDAALILDFIDGPSLAERLANGDRPTTDEAISIALDIAAALAVAHEAGIVHRDVTPGNILLDPGDGARLTDFGIALGGAGTDGEPALTATGQLVGTLRYVAPEQLRGAPASPASDVHSLAAVLYEMLAGRPAYEAATPVALAEAQARPVEPIRSVPPALDAVVRGALATDPADRPANGRQFATALAETLSLAPTESIAIPEAAPDETSSMPVVAAAAAGAPLAAASGVEPLWAPAVDAGAASEAHVQPLSGDAGPLWDADPSAPAAAEAATPAPAARPARDGRGHSAWEALPISILVVGVLLAGLVFAAALGPGPTAGVASPSPIAPAASTPPSAEPTPAPLDSQGGDKKGKGDGKGKGKGNDGGD
jgi:serine/threonine-protein kinase